MQVFIVAEASTFGNIVKPECHAEVEKVFSRGDVGKFSYSGHDCSFRWRIIETDQ